MAKVVVVHKGEIALADELKNRGETEKGWEVNCFACPVSEEEAAEQTGEKIRHGEDDSDEVEESKREMVEQADVVVCLLNEPLVTAVDLPDALGGWKHAFRKAFGGQDNIFSVACVFEDVDVTSNAARKILSLTRFTLLVKDRNEVAELLDHVTRVVEQVSKPVDEREEWALDITERERRNRILPLPEGFSPFSVIKSKATELHSGTRKWMVEKVQEWYRDPQCANRPLMFLGPPGFGKSVCMAHVCVEGGLFEQQQEGIENEKSGRGSSRRFGWLRRKVETLESNARVKVVAAHFFRWDSDIESSVQTCLVSLANQLAIALPSYGAELCKLEVPEGVDLVFMFRRLLAIPLTKIAPCQQNLVVVLDGVDEAAIDEQVDLLSIISLWDKEMPMWLKVLVTARPSRALRVASDSLVAVEFHIRDEEHIHDVEKVFEPIVFDCISRTSEEKYPRGYGHPTIPPARDVKDWVDSLSFFVQYWMTLVDTLHDVLFRQLRALKRQLALKGLYGSTRFEDFPSARQLVEKSCKGYFVRLLNLLHDDHECYQRLFSVLVASPEGGLPLHIFQDIFKERKDVFDYLELLCSIHDGKVSLTYGLFRYFLVHENRVSRAGKIRFGKPLHVQAKMGHQIILDFLRQEEVPSDYAQSYTTFHWVGAEDEAKRTLLDFKSLSRVDMFRKSELLEALRWVSRDKDLRLLSAMLENRFDMDFRRDPSTLYFHVALVCPSRTHPFLDSFKKEHPELKKPPLMPLSPGRFGKYNPVLGLTIDANQPDLAASITGQGIVKLWNIETGSELETMHLQRFPTYRGLAMDRGQLYYTTMNSLVQCDLETKAETEIFRSDTTRQCNLNSWRCALSGSSIVIGTQDYTKIIDIRTKSISGSLPGSNELCLKGNVLALAADADSWKDGVLSMWDLRKLESFEAYYVQKVMFGGIDFNDELAIATVCEGWDREKLRVCAWNRSRSCDSVSTGPFWTSPCGFPAKCKLLGDSVLVASDWSLSLWTPSREEAYQKVFQVGCRVECVVTGSETVLIGGSQGDVHILRVQ